MEKQDMSTYLTADKRRSLRARERDSKLVDPTRPIVATRPPDREQGRTAWRNQERDHYKAHADKLAEALRDAQAWIRKNHTLLANRSADAMNCQISATLAAYEADQ